MAQGPTSSSPAPVRGPVIPDVQGANLPNAFHLGALEVMISSSESTACVSMTAEEDKEVVGRSLRPRLPLRGNTLDEEEGSESC